MKALAAVVLSLAVGACATFGQGEPDLFGVYDYVPMAGEMMEMEEHSIELRKGERYGRYQIRMINSARGIDHTPTGMYRVSEEGVDGRYQLEMAMGRGRFMAGTVCGEVLTMMEDQMDLVFHKRR